MTIITFGAAFAQQGRIPGKVSDDKGIGLPSCSIVIDGNNKSAVTDIEGNFSIENLARGEIQNTVYSRGISATLDRQGFTKAYIGANPNAVYSTQGSMHRSLFLTASYKFI